jgi:hypothetical protein
MSNYPPSSVDLFFTGFTRPEVRIEGHRAATVTYRPDHRIIPFWRFFFVACFLLMAGLFIWGDIELWERIQLGFALMAGFTLLAGYHMLPWRGTASFARGSVTLFRKDGLGRVAEQWSEPLTAYRGLRTWRENWTAESQPFHSPSVSTSGAGSGIRMKIAKSQAWVFLEHATDPARSLPVMRRDGFGDPLEVEDFARHLSLTVLERVNRQRFDMSAKS